jgi:hypothetical protein
MRCEPSRSSSTNLVDTLNVSVRTIMLSWPLCHRLTPCSFDLSATGQQYFSLITNQPPATSQQYFSLRTNQHQPSATSQRTGCDLLTSFIGIVSIVAQSLGPCDYSGHQLIRWCTGMFGWSSRENCQARTAAWVLPGCCLVGDMRNLPDVIHLCCCLDARPTKSAAWLLPQAAWQ